MLVNISDKIALMGEMTFIRMPWSDYIYTSIIDFYVKGPCSGGQPWHLSNSGI